MAYVPDSWLGPLLRMTDADPDIAVVAATREEEALAICCGALFADMKSVLVIQNSGLLSSGSGVVTLLTMYRLPLLMLISYRGSHRDPNFFHIPKGQATEPVLTGLGIPYAVASPHEDLGRQVERAFAYAEQSSVPFALLLNREDLLGDQHTT
ncbi:MAG: sulfopyruvate decarboxylase [Anaerolineae bacterium]